METERFKIEGSDLDIIGKDVKVGGVIYTETPGLYELLFKKQRPIGYNKADLDNYLNMLIRYNAYRRNFSPEGQVQGSSKRKNIERSLDRV